MAQERDGKGYGDPQANLQELHQPPQTRRIQKRNGTPSWPVQNNRRTTLVLRTHPKTLLPAPQPARADTRPTHLWKSGYLLCHCYIGRAYHREASTPFSLAVAFWGRRGLVGFFPTSFPSILFCWSLAHRPLTRRFWDFEPSSARCVIFFGVFLRFSSGARHVPTPPSRTYAPRKTALTQCTVQVTSLLSPLTRSSVGVRLP